MTRRVVAISGPPGAGKSTLLAALAEKMAATAVQYDDYEVITRWPPARVVAWLDAGAPFDQVIAPGLYARLLALDGLILLETPFGRACPQTGPLIDAAIWLECPADLALSRKLATLAQVNQGRADFAAMLSGWLEAYQGFTHRALNLQRDRVRPTADLILSSTDASEKMVSSVFSFLNQHLAP